MEWVSGEAASAGYASDERRLFLRKSALLDEALLPEEYPSEEGCSFLLDLGYLHLGYGEQWREQLVLLAFLFHRFPKPLQPQFVKGHSGRIGE